MSDVAGGASADNCSRIFLSEFKRAAKAWFAQYLTVNRPRDGFHDKVVSAHHTLDSVTSEKGTGFHSPCLSDMLFASAFLSA